MYSFNINLPTTAYNLKQKGHHW